MHRDREHPLYYLEAETLLVATHVWVDDGFKALQAQGFKLPQSKSARKPPWPSFSCCKARTWPPRPPSKPTSPPSRFYRVLQKAQGLLAYLAIGLSGGEGLLQVVDQKPLLLAHGHRMRGLRLPEAAVGVGPLGASGGYVPMPVTNGRGLFFRWALLPGRPGGGSGWRTFPRSWGIGAFAGFRGSGHRRTRSGEDGRWRRDGEGQELD